MAISNGTGASAVKLGTEGDIITELAQFLDVIKLERVDANLGLAGDQEFSWRGGNPFTGVGQLRYASSGADKIVSAHIDGDLAAQFQIRLSHVDFSLFAGHLDL
jgi:hypothetical protein